MLGLAMDSQRTNQSQPRVFFFAILSYPNQLRSMCVCVFSKNFSFLVHFLPFHSIEKWCNLVYASAEKLRKPSKIQKTKKVITFSSSTLSTIARFGTPAAQILNHDLINN